MGVNMNTLSNRVAAYAAAAGSTAKTTRGLLRVALAAARSKPSLMRRELGIAGVPERVARLTTREQWRARKWTAGERMAARARDDKNFRRREIIKIAWRRGSFENLLDQIHRLPDRMADATNLRYSLPQLPPWAAVVPADFAAADHAGARPCRRGKDAECRGCARSTHFHHEDGEAEWRGGRPRRYTRAVNVTHVRSVAQISPDGRTAEYRLHETDHRLVTPDGYRWDIDRLGLRLVRIADGADHHPDAMDLVRGVGGTVAALQTAHDARRAAELRARYSAAAQSADPAQTWVSLADSVAAGNCPTGSRTFALNHGLDPRRHVRGDVLLRVANGEECRVRRAILQAAMREAADIDRGYATI
jgi:hypothetical protein